METIQRRVTDEVDRIFPELVRISRAIHASPELGFHEKEASARLREFLEQRGFQVEPVSQSLPTAFRAWRGGDASPSVAFLAEYDALPKLGHACGHNLIAAASTGAGAALAASVPDGPGRVYVVGTPAEERHGGKIRMIQEGGFAGIDAALMFHPSVRNAVVKRTLSMTELKISFHGRSTHAAAAPELGINALDAMILMFTGINALRQQTPEDARIHGIITDGGDAPNVIPDYTAARLSVRALDVQVMAGLVERVKECARGAAQSTGCTCEIEVAGPVYEGLVPNYSLAGVFQKHAESLGVVMDDTDEMKYIGSSDIGNVSRVMPALHPELTIAGIDHLPHTPGFAKAALSETGEEVMRMAAKALALTGLEVLTDGEFRAQMIREFQDQRSQKGGTGE